MTLLKINKDSPEYKQGRKDAYNLGFKDGEENMLLEFEKIINQEIINEEDAKLRKVKRDWTIIKELEFVKIKLNELKEKIKSTV